MIWKSSTIYILLTRHWCAWVASNEKRNSGILFCELQNLLWMCSSVCGWVAKEIRTVHIEEYLHFVNDLRFAYEDEDGVGPEVGDKISLLSGCPELSRETRTMTLFRIRCLFFFSMEKWICLKSTLGQRLGLVTDRLFWGSSSPWRNYLLWNNGEFNLFIDAYSIIELLVRLETFAGIAVEPGYSSCTFVDFFDTDEVLKEPLNCYKEIRVAAAVGSDTLNVSASEVLCVESSLPAQHPKFNVS